MPRRRASRRSPRKPGKKRRSGSSLSRLWPDAQTRKRWWKLFIAIPLTLQVIVGVVVLGLLWFTSNGVYQVIRKPTELFFPVSGTLNKVPVETWREYGTIFRRHATQSMTPEFLAALAQVEASGNPIVRTYWSLSFKRDPFEMYRPASSAVGMYQITDGTFEEARRYCIHDHVVVEDGRWDEPRSCWFNWLYFRVVPSHAVEMTSAYLDRSVANVLRRHRVAATVLQKQEVATLAHLCGAGMAEGYVRRGLHFLPGQRCGDHDPRVYLRRVNEMRATFRRLAAQDD